MRKPADGWRRPLDFQNYLIDLPLPTTTTTPPQLVLTGVTKSRDDAEAAAGAFRPLYAVASLGDLAPLSVP